MNEDLVELVNEHCRSRNLVNRIFGIRLNIDSQIECRILPEDEEQFWLPLSQNCVMVENFIKKWIELDGEVK
jgi:hypothetical protein